jgi:glycosyltransferase involved in cell wall biosynthesis
MDPGVSNPILRLGDRLHKQADKSVLSDKRVAIVCGHFAPEIGYQEVDLARAFTRLGARVRVVTSTKVSPSARAIVRSEYPRGLAEAEGYEILRLAPPLTVGPNVLGCKVEPAVADFGPDYVILVGPGKLFGLELFSSESSWRRIAVMQDNSEAVPRTSSAWRIQMRAVAHRLVKRPAYRRVVRNADRIILNVPETREIVESWLEPREREILALKGLELRLGFDHDTFFFRPGTRREWRDLHGVGEDEFVLVTCTRAMPQKRLEDVISAVSRLRAQGVALRYVLAGLLGDSYATRLRELAAAQPEPRSFLLLPVLQQSEMRDMFCACDLGFWPQAAITIQQAMGTGLPVVLRRRPTVSHLLTPGRNGWYVGSHERLEQTLRAALGSLSALSVGERLTRRKGIAEFNRSYLSYDVIAAEMVDGL